MHTRKQARTHFLLFLCCCSLLFFFFSFLFQSGRLFPYAQAVVLYVFKGLSWPKSWFQKLASPVPRLTIPHRDYFNFLTHLVVLPVHLSPKKIFQPQRNEKSGSPKKSNFSTSTSRQKNNFLFINFSKKANSCPPPKKKQKKGGGGYQKINKIIIIISKQNIIQGKTKSEAKHNLFLLLAE